MNANTETVIIYPKDLPLHCSGPNHETWNGHPRVFLPISPTATSNAPTAERVTISKATFPTTIIETL